MSGYPGANRPQHHQQYQQPQYAQQQQGYQQPQYAPPQQQFHQPQYAPPQQQYQQPQYAQQQRAHFPPPQGAFGQSNGRNGKRKALTIGINYVGTKNQLAGCHNDSRNIVNFLTTRYGFNPDDIVILTDTPGQSQRAIPTRANMIAGMQWLVAGAQPGDSLFFHYSGHGGQTKDLDGDEADGMDDTILPLDFQSAGEIIDDDLHAILVRSLPVGCRLTALFDSCHSGTALDLPYVYSTQGQLKGPNLLAEAGQGAMGAVTSYARGDLMGAFSALTTFGKQAMNGNKASEATKQTKTSYADVISISGCKDSQTSADTNEAGKATGALSYFFIDTLTQNPQQSYNQLLNSIRNGLRQKYDQKPQLSCSHELDNNMLFVI